MGEVRGPDGVIEVGGCAKYVVLNSAGEGSFSGAYVVGEGETEASVGGGADSFRAYVFGEFFSVGVRGVAFSISMGERG